MRKHPHRNHGQFHEDAAGKWIFTPARRNHGLLTHVKPTPSALRSAVKRARVYMHSAARQRRAIALAETSPS